MMRDIILYTFYMHNIYCIVHNMHDMHYNVQLQYGSELVHAEGCANKIKNSGI